MARRSNEENRVSKLGFGMKRRGVGDPAAAGRAAPAGLAFRALHAGSTLSKT